MITQQTILVLGAGASKPYGYPTGADLKKLICNETQELLDQFIPNADTIDYSWQKDYIASAHPEMGCFELLVKNQGRSDPLLGDNRGVQVINLH